MKNVSQYLSKAIDYATKCHENVNHTYDGNPYFYHLDQVAAFARKYNHHYSPSNEEFILAACYGHDLIEDTRQTYNDVLKALGPEAAEIVFALTNEKGKSRKDRANSKYYDDMKKVPFAVFVKICDRLANASYSAKKGRGMIDVYMKENALFKQRLFAPGYEDMFVELDFILFKQMPEPKS